MSGTSEYHGEIRRQSASCSKDAAPCFSYDITSKHANLDKRGPEQPVPQGRLAATFSAWGELTLAIHTLSLLEPQFRERDMP